jgi:tripartite-type tricarboxylate transporter receptor subunit TctC
LRALAVAYRKRLQTFPNVPTTVEKGYEKLNISVWIGYFVPVKTPRAVTSKLAEVFDQALQDKQIIAKIEKARVTVENQGPDEAAKFLTEEHEKWSEVARVARITP